MGHWTDKQWVKLGFLAAGLVFSAVLLGILSVSGLRGKMSLSANNLPSVTNFERKDMLAVPSVTICPRVNGGESTVTLYSVYKLFITDALEQNSTISIFNFGNRIPFPATGENPVDASAFLSPTARKLGISVQVLPFSVGGQRCGNIQINNLDFYKESQQLVVGVDMIEPELKITFYRAVTWGLYSATGGSTNDTTLITTGHDQITFASIKQSVSVKPAPKNDSAQVSTSKQPESSSHAAEPSNDPPPSAEPSSTTDPSSSSTPPVAERDCPDDSLCVTSYDASAQPVSQSNVGDPTTVTEAFLIVNFDDLVVQTTTERDDGGDWASAILIFISSLTGLEIPVYIYKICKYLGEKAEEKAKEKAEEGFERRKDAKGKKPKDKKGYEREMAPVTPSRV